MNLCLKYINEHMAVSLSTRTLIQITVLNEKTVFVLKFVYNNDVCGTEVN